MKVYFSGAHASGKTTLARYVSTQYRLPMISEVARTILSEKELHIDTLRYDLDVVDDYQRQVFQRQLDEEKKLNSSSYVSDRSAIDTLAYAANHSRILSQLFYNPQFEDYIAKLKKEDCYLFFVRPCKATLQQDGVRESLNWDGVVAIDAMLKLLMEIFNLKYFTINTDSMQERVKLINNILDTTKKVS